MAEGTVTMEAWQEQEDLRKDLALARCEISSATYSLKHSLNPKERAKEFVRDRPLAAALATLAVGIVVSRVLPALIWRSKSGLFQRFTGELVKGAAGMALPFLTSRLSAALRPRHDPEAIIYTGRDGTLT